MMKLVKINNTTASHPFLRDSVVRAYYRLRNTVKYETGGMDILSDVELSKPKNFVDHNPNIGYRSRLKCSDALVVKREFIGDGDGNPRILIAKERVGRFTYFRIWIYVDDQSGKYGQKLKLTDCATSLTYEGYFVDFTELAEYCDWRRVAAVDESGFSQHTEYHYTEGLSYEEAMLYLHSKFPKFHSLKDARKPPHLRVLGLNDRGSAVRNIQERLRTLGYLSYKDITGVLDKHTQTVLKCVQDKYGLDSDGLVGEKTRELLYRLTEQQ